MRKWIAGLAVLLAVSWNVCAAEEKPAGEVKSFPVYTDAKSPDNHFIPSGWMGDFGDLSMDDKYMGEPHAGSTSIKFVYTAKK
ncbi:MAG: hypothetical protein PHO59_05445, partial [Candidatus Omnitrophica bacterium]|nr:hypothetical protein [Candidatus Omnitrophota bacterium]